MKRKNTRPQPERTARVTSAIASADPFQQSIVVGAANSHKTTEIETVLAAVATGDRAMIADAGGVYNKAFYDPNRGDAILSLFDPRAPVWDLFAEIKSKQDIRYIARAFVRDSVGKTSQLNEDARTYFTDTTEQLWRAGNLDMRHGGQSPSTFHTAGELYRVLTEEPIGGTVPGLKALLSGTASETFLRPENASRFASIRTIASFTLQELRHLNRPEEKSLSVREWAKNSAGKGAVLFMPYEGREIEAFKPMISAWMYFGMQGAMEGPNKDRHLWLVDAKLGLLVDRNLETKTRQLPQNVSKKTASIRGSAVKHHENRKKAVEPTTKQADHRSGNKTGASARRRRNGGFDR